MKKFIALAVALVSFGALAQENRHMVTISGWEDGGNYKGRSLDLHWSEDDEDGNELERTNLSLNYAYAINGSWQVGGKYRKFSEERDGDVVQGGDETTYGLFVIYNFAGRLHNTNYLSLGYDWTDSDDSDVAKDGFKSNTWNLEFGHRFSLGTVWGMNFNWSPSITLSMENSEDNVAGSDKIKTTSLDLAVVKFDVLF